MQIIHEIARTQITQFATDHGFGSVGFTTAGDASRFPELCKWLDRGFAASMGYMQKRKAAYRNPRSVLADCQTLIMLSLPYQGHAWTKRVVKRGRDRQPFVEQRPTIASYAAAGEDYHHWIRRKLKPLVRELQRMFPDCQTRAVVDTTPLLERNFAEQAGLGWIGKNTMLLNRELGSYFFLCAILTQANLSDQAATEFPMTPESGTPSLSHLSSSHCGTCRACLDACPTQAFVEPYVLDANKCISYWTIEHRGAIPETIRSSIGPWIFGCDLCQIVCPWNHKVRVEIPEGMQPHLVEKKSDCMHWLELDQMEFESLYKTTPFWRTGLLGMQRNAMIVAANTRMLDAVPKIRKFTTHSDSELRSLALWALKILG
ncbi:MAG: tRNA epoxyqueuosine(34) reductase QueG [Pirellula sp.]